MHLLMQNGHRRDWTLVRAHRHSTLRGLRASSTAVADLTISSSSLTRLTRFHGTIRFFSTPPQSEACMARWNSVLGTSPINLGSRSRVPLVGGESSVESPDPLLVPPVATRTTSGDSTRVRDP